MPVSGRPAGSPETGGWSPQQHGAQHLAAPQPSEGQSPYSPEPLYPEEPTTPGTIAPWLLKQSERPALQAAPLAQPSPFGSGPETEAGGANAPWNQGADFPMRLGERESSRGGVTRAAHVPSGRRSTVHEAPTVAHAQLDHTQGMAPQRPLQPSPAPQAPPPVFEESALALGTDSFAGSVGAKGEEPRLRLQAQDRRTTQPRRKNGGGIAWILGTAVVVGTGGMVALSYLHQEPAERLDAVAPTSGIGTAPHSAPTDVAAHGAAVNSELNVAAAAPAAPVDGATEDGAENGPKPEARAAANAADGERANKGQPEAANAGNAAAARRAAARAATARGKARRAAAAPMTAEGSGGKSNEAQRSASKRTAQAAARKAAQRRRSANDSNAQDAVVGANAVQASDRDPETTASIESAREALKALGGDEAVPDEAADPGEPSPIDDPAAKLAPEPY